MTKQQRSIGYLYKTFDDVIGLGLTGKIIIAPVVSLCGAKFGINVTLFNRKKELVFDEFIVRDEYSYAKFCNKIIELEMKLR